MEREPISAPKSSWQTVGAASLPFTQNCIGNLPAGGVPLSFSCSMSLSMLWAAPDGVRALKSQLFKPARSKNPSGESERGVRYHSWHHSREGRAAPAGWRGVSHRAAVKTLLWNGSASSTSALSQPGHLGTALFQFPQQFQELLCPQGSCWSTGRWHHPLLHPWHIVRPLCSLFLGFWVVAEMAFEVLKSF